MIFKAIQEKFKVKSGLKYLEDELGKSKPISSRETGVSSIGCIVDMDKYPDADEFNKLINDFSLKPNGVKIIGYKKEEEVNSPFAIQFCTDKDLGWNGTIENGFV